MLFSFLGKAEGGKELCSGGETLLKGGKSQGAIPPPPPPPPMYASLVTDRFFVCDLTKMACRIKQSAAYRNIMSSQPTNLPVL